MILDEIHELAISKTPKVDAQKLTDVNRYGLFEFVRSAHAIGVELGVAGGSFTEKAINSGVFALFFGVDQYGDHHDNKEYINTLRRLDLVNPTCKLIRSDFSSALDLFPDHSLDFIYFDGYAHNGEEGGTLFCDWFDKVKPGGIIAGDDYHADWPLVVWAVNNMVKQLGVQLNVTSALDEGEFSESFPSWFFVKPHSEVGFELDDTISSLCKKIVMPPKYTFKSEGEFIRVVQQYIKTHGQDKILALLE